MRKFAIKYLNNLKGINRFDVITDHRPLIGIFAKSLPQIDNTRFARLREKIIDYSFDVKWVAGKDNIIADALSRSASSTTTATQFPTGHVLQLQKHTSNTSSTWPTNAIRIRWSSRLLTRQRNSGISHVITLHAVFNKFGAASLNPRKACCWWTARRYTCHQKQEGKRLDYYTKATVAITRP